MKNSRNYVTKSLKVLPSLFLLGNLYATDAVTGFDVNGWNSDDTRNSSGTNIINGTTNAPASGATSDPTQVSNQLNWINYLGSTGNLGGLQIDTSSSASQKSTISVIDTSTGFSAASVLTDPSFSANYVWQNNDTVVPGPALKFGVQSTEYGSGSGQSQEGFAATRSGEATWDLILVFDPTNNGQNSDVNGRFYSTTVTENSQFFLFPQASNAYWASTYGATSDTIGINAGSRTMDEWAALDIDGAPGGLTWGDVLFDTGAVISDVQLGMGSGNAGALTTVDYVEVSFLNGGERYDFVEGVAYTGGGSDPTLYSDADNWGGVAPSAADNFVVDLDGTTNLNVTGASSTSRSLGILAGTTNLTLASGQALILPTATNGTLYIAPDATLNLTGDGELNASVLESGGVANIAVTGTLDGGADPHPVRDGSTSRYGMVVLEGGEITLQDGADITVSQDNLNVGVRVGEGAGDAGVLNIESGASLVVGNDTDFGTSGLTSNGFFHAGDWGSTGIVNQTGGSFELKDGSFNLGNQAGDGTYNLSGGTATLSGGLHSLGRNTGSRAAGIGTLNISGGEFTLQASPNNGNGSFIIGDREASDNDGTGIVNQTGGVFRISGSSNLYLGGYGASTYNLEGGALEIGGSSLKGNYGSATTDYDFNLGGGTIRVIDSDLTTSVDINVVDLDPSANVTASTIDTNGFNATFSGGLSGDGGLVKIGAGKAALSGSQDRSMAFLNIEQGEVEHVNGTTEMSGLLAGRSPATSPDSDGVFTLTNGTVDITANGGALHIGSGDSGENNGTLNIDGGTLNLGVAGDGATRVDAYIGAFGTTGEGVVNQTGGTVNKLSDDGVFHIGNQAKGTYNISAGAINIMGDNGMVLGRSGSFGDGDGTLNISGGEIIFTEGTDLVLGGAQDSEPLTGSGVVNQTGGTVSLRDGGNLVLGQRGSGTYNLRGGSLEVGGANRIKSGNGGAATFNLGGGIINVISGLTVGSDINPNLETGTTSTINTNSFDALFAGAFSGSGNLNKSGAGKLTLSGASTNTGFIAVNEGSLVVSGSVGGSQLSVASGASLSGTGTINAPTLINGTLRPGNSPGIISFTNDLTINGQVDFEAIANSTANRGVNFDGINMDGGAFTLGETAFISLIFDGAGSTVDYTDAFWTTSQNWLFVENAGELTIGSGVIFAVSDDSNGMTFDSSIGGFDLLGIGGNLYINFVPVPEPGHYAALAGLICLFICVRRRRRA
ncbi:beta strand repeat-containing protein [Cerasicoccus fimbriatus]|uniref:beta strand repeat-containing protein n=1 Tax=Cerasicoccus fimbriatus TaxID=3014554 RepID=UPI0022B31FB2|nr:hypothetical protein [Cerasicoccus sp. TK19100]